MRIKLIKIFTKLSTPRFKPIKNLNNHTKKGSLSRFKIVRVSNNRSSIRFNNSKNRFLWVNKGKSPQELHKISLILA